jgi:hypothetical protein
MDTGLGSMREMKQKARAVEMTQESSAQERALNTSRAARARFPEDKEAKETYYRGKRDLL